MDEAQVHHLVSLVEDEDFERRQVEDALIDQVEQAARSGDEHVDNILLAAKSIVITVIFFLAYSFSKKDLSGKKWVVPVIGLLTIVNVVLAVVGGIVQSGAASGM